MNKFEQVFSDDHQMSLVGGQARGQAGACMAGGVSMAGGMHGRGVCVAGKTAIAVGGTHPTRVHSCSENL